MCSVCRSDTRCAMKKKGCMEIYKAKKVYINADEPHGAHTFRVLVLRRAKLSKKEARAEPMRNGGSMQSSRRQM